jgi:hypothetical protein
MLVPLLLYLPLLLQPAVADTSLGRDMKNLCSQVSSLTSCKITVALPTARLRYAKQKFFRFNKCKTKRKFPWGGWTCEPGTETVWVEVPVGIDIGSKQVGTCDLMRRAFGSDALLKMSSQAGVICKCLPEVRWVWRG